MLLKVNPHKIEIEKEPVNEREINISKCYFEFADEITSEYVKEAYFTFEGTTYKQIIVNDECDFPSEVLTEKGQVEIGVVAYIVEDETEIKRYNPSPVYFNTWQGSLKDDYENSEPITPTDKEQIEQAITNLQNDVDDLEENKQDTLVSGENIKTINGESLLGEGDIKIDQNFVKDDDYVHTDNNYTNAEKEKLASLENYDDTGIKNDISDIKDEQRTQNGDISQNKADIEALSESLTNYSLTTETGSQIVLNVNSSNYQMTAILKDKNGNVIYTSNAIDLPIESMIINVAYDSDTKEIVFTLQNGNVLRVSVADLVSGLVSTDELNTILASYYTKTEVDNLLSSKANASDVYTKSQTDNLLNAKQNTLTFDTIPTENSTNPVTSGGIYDSQAEQNTQIDALNNLVDQLPVVTEKGTDISLQDVFNYRMKKLDIFGNASQFSTTGKNLLSMTDFENNGSGRTSFVINDNEIVITTLSSGTYRYVTKTINNLTIGETYTFSLGTYQDGSNGLAEFGIVDSQGSYYVYHRYLNQFQTLTFTPTETSVAVRLGYFGNAVNQNVVLKVSNIQLEKGSSATDYEPYTGGIPAPNPSYPYPIKVVTGENSLIVQNENFLNYNVSSQTIHGVTFTVNSDKSITVNGTASQNVAFYLFDKTLNLKKGVYVLNGCPSGGDAAKYYLGTDIMGSNWQEIGSGITLNVANDVTNKSISVVVKGGQTVNNLVFKPMLVKGSTAPTSYVAHQEQNYSISLGDIELNSSPDGTIRDQIKGSSDVSYNKLNYDLEPENYFYSATGIKTYDANNTYINQQIEMKNIRDITFTAESVTGSTTLRVCEFNSDGSFIKRTLINTIEGHITLDDSTSYIITSTNKSNNAYFVKPQITEGSEVKPYFPYGQVGMWWKREYIVKVVLDGSENWGASSTYTNETIYSLYLALSNYKNNSQFISDLFTYQNITPSTTTEYIATGGDSIRIGILKSRLNAYTVNDFKQWLSTHNTTVYYQLATPVDIQITDTTLIEQLNNIYNNVYSYNGTTNITSTFEDGNEQMVIEASALMDLNSLVTRIETLESEV